MPSSWEEDEAALVLLDERGGPFESNGFRRALCATSPHWRDTSFAAVTDDGTRAGVAMMTSFARAESVPFGYGGLVADRVLTPSESTSFLALARRRAGAQRLVVRALGGRGNFGTTSIVRFEPGVGPERGYTGNARRSQAKARREGADVERSSDPAPFLKLYTAAAEQWAMQYPSALIEQVLANGAAECHNVVREGEVIGSGLALRGGTHWMYWLAAQNQEGRSRHSGYLSVDSVLRTACAEGVGWVNLGGNRSGEVELEGVAAFKRRLGAEPVPVSEYTTADGLGWAMLRAERLARRTLGPARRRVRAALR